MKMAIAWYDDHATELAAQYESLAPESVHGWVADLLPQGKALALDVGAGTGRDAAWLTSLGYEVVAVEPSARMREEGQRLHSNDHMQWLNDSLPDFRNVFRLGLSFDFILLSAVWMHIPEVDRSRAFRKLITLLKPGGLMAISLRQGPTEAVRGMYPISEQEIERLAKEHGAFVERRRETPDQRGRAEISWVQMAVRLPDDGTGALEGVRDFV